MQGSSPGTTAAVGRQANTQRCLSLSEQSTKSIDACLGDQVCIYYDAGSGLYSCEALSADQALHRFGKELVSQRCVDTEAPAAA